RLPASADIAHGRPGERHLLPRPAGNREAATRDVVAMPRHAVRSSRGVGRAGPRISTTTPSPRSMRVPGVTTIDSPRSRVRTGEPGPRTSLPLSVRISVATTATPGPRNSWRGEQVPAAGLETGARA